MELRVGQRVRLKTLEALTNNPFTFFDKDGDLRIRDDEVGDVLFFKEEFPILGQVVTIGEIAKRTRTGNKLTLLGLRSTEDLNFHDVSIEEVLD